MDLNLKALVRVTVFSIMLSSIVSLGAEAKPLSPITVEDQAQRLSELQHLPWNGKSTTHDVTRDSECWYSKEKIEVWDPVTKQGLRYTVDVRRPVVNYKVPVILIIPTIEGTHDMLEPHVAAKLCSAKMASIIANINDTNQPATYPSWGMEDQKNRRAILALKTFIDWAEKVPMFDKTKIGMMGLSLGGITTGLMTGLEPRLKAAVTVVGGGNMPYILTVTDESRLTTLRDRRMQAANLPNLNAYEDALRNTIKYDPVYFANRARRGNILMVMAEGDVKVPYSAQRELFNAYGGPNGLTFTGGHVQTIVTLAYLYMDRVTDFFNQKFNAKFVDDELIDQPVTYEEVNLDQLGL